MEVEPAALLVLSSQDLPPVAPAIDVNDLEPPPPNTPLTHPAIVDNSTLMKSPFWVSPPPLRADEKQQYKELASRMSALSTDEEDETPVSIVGETRIGTDHFYWVAYQNDIVHRHLVKEFNNSHRALVDAYRKQQEEGFLEEFDPNSSRIHPKDRINLSGARKTRVGPPGPGRIKSSNRSRTSKQKPIVIDSEDENPDSEEDDYASSDEDEDEEEDDSDFKARTKKIRPPTRRSTRVASSKTKFDYRDMSASPEKMRVNPKRGARTRVADDSYDEDIDESDAKEEKPKLMKRKLAPGRLSRPAYGNVRPVADLSDDDSNDDLAPLRAHRRLCERCEEPPTHELLAKYYKRGKQRAKPRRAKMDADLEGEDVEAEEDRLLAMGGWVRCLKCCVAAHWKCLATTQRDEIMKAVRSKEKDAEIIGSPQRIRESVDAYSTTEFFCNRCIQGGICMVCLDTVVETEARPEKKVDVSMEHPEEETALVLKPTDSMLSNKDTSNNTPPPVISIDAPTPRKDETTVSNDVSTHVSQVPKHDAAPFEISQERPFRCITCKRLAHYAHLPQPNPGEVLASAELARHYQMENDWKCADCVSFVDPLDKILAWRPYPANATERPRPAGEVPNYKSHLPREYLVKWAERSYRRLAWVPHMWLVSTNGGKLKNFLATGPKVHLLNTSVDDTVGEGKDTSAVGDSLKEPSFSIADENSRESSAQPASGHQEGPPPASVDAERRIPPAWKTVDRILDIRVWDPAGRGRLRQLKKAKTRKSSRRRKRVDSDSESEDNFAVEAELERIAAREHGEEPGEDFLETMEEWEERTGDFLDVEHAELVIWAFIKWEELAYEESTWDSPPGQADQGWGPFVGAFRRFLHSREVFVPIRNKNQAKAFDGRPKAMFEKKQLALEANPDLGQDENLKLMDFQLTGVNWLFRNWWRGQPSILADDMGLGKTVQIATVVGHLIENYKAYPVLIAVPNSTITNWLREFARWAPKLRVVPYNGDAKSRDIIRKYELYHNHTGKNHTNLKFHVLVTTYDTLLGKDFGSVFKSVPRWELLIIDEGQRLKNDSSLLFRKLNELNAIHRILMTGTPLNNNIRELFNLMNFLDPTNWNDLSSLEKKYETLTEELLSELHEALKPYFLRRTKADVLKLPPKNEVIVPVSMTTIQKEVYKSILSQNAEVLATLARPSSSVNSTVKKSNLRNVLMQLRKCLQHPYLVSRDLEPTSPELTPSDVHRNLLEASAKLRLLHLMLPKLQAKGHRVLLFSQFTIALDIIEDFITGEGYKFLRLDGKTKQAQRQQDMDSFNRTDSDVFIYLLSTRAGGVGVNLWSADTVIIFDPDFNPHQDLQAISRAHRYGQTKTVLVFKLMVKGAAEERIVQAGKKKLALDHLIVQKMDDDGATDDVQSILTFGAKAIFENSELHNINYTDADIDTLITRTEKEGEDAPETTSSQLSFGFAKLWVVEKDSMEEVAEDASVDVENDGFWSGVLARAAVEKEKAKAAEVTGRGAKRKAAISQTYNYDDGSPVKPKLKKRRKSSGDSDVEYHVSEADSVNNMRRSSPSTVDDTTFLTDDEQLGVPLQRSIPALATPPIPEKKHHKYETALAAIENGKRKIESDEYDNDEGHCGLCHTIHGPAACIMTEDSSNLLDYRKMLLTESPEPANLRFKAVRVIEQNLMSRGLSHLIKDELYSSSSPRQGAEPTRRKKHKVVNNHTTHRPTPPIASSSTKKSGHHGAPQR